MERIINDELNNFFKTHSLNEIENDDVINPDNINLKYEYDKINKELFDNKLPRVPLQWSNRKGNLGHVRANVSRFGNDSIIRFLAISSFYAMPYSVLKDTLAHEMIHIKQLTTKTFDRRSPHGYDFLIEARRINNMGLNYNITVVSEDRLGLSDKTKTKSNNVLVATILLIDGRYSINVTTPTVFEKYHDNIINILKRIIRNGKYRKIEMYSVESNNPELLKYTIQRNYSSLKHAPLSDELRNDLLNSRPILDIAFDKSNIDEASEVNNNNDWEEIIIV